MVKKKILWSPTTPLKAKDKKSNYSLRITTKKGGRGEKTGTPLIVLLAWLASKDRHIEHYRKFYHAKRFDVLTVKVTVAQILLPRRGTQVLARRALDFMRDNLDNYNKFVVHAFSVGAYIFGEMLVVANENPKEYNPVMEKLSAVVLDSPVDVADMPTGLARSLSPNPVIMKILQSAIVVFLWAGRKVATQHYVRASKMFFSAKNSWPSVWFGSRKDVIVKAESVERGARRWEDLGSNVTLKIWDDSEHVRHMPLHREEYREAIEMLLAKIGCELSEVERGDSGKKNKNDMSSSDTTILDL